MRSLATYRPIARGRRRYGCCVVQILVPLSGARRDVQSMELGVLSSMNAVSRRIRSKAKVLASTSKPFPRPNGVMVLVNW